MMNHTFLQKNKGKKIYNMSFKIYNKMFDWTWLHSYKCKLCINWSYLQHLVWKKNLNNIIVIIKGVRVEKWISFWEKITLTFKCINTEGIVLIAWNEICLLAQTHPKGAGFDDISDYCIKQNEGK